MIKDEILILLNIHYFNVCGMHLQCNNMINRRNCKNLKIKLLLTFCAVAVESDRMPAITLSSACCGRI